MHASIQTGCVRVCGAAGTPTLRRALLLATAQLCCPSCAGPSRPAAARPGGQQAAAAAARSQRRRRAQVAVGAGPGLARPMAQSIHYSLVTEPRLLDVVDDEWRRDTLPDDGAPGAATTAVPAARRRRPRLSTAVQTCPCRRACSRLLKKRTTCALRLSSNGESPRGGRSWACNDRQRICLFR